MTTSTRGGFHVINILIAVAAIIVVFVIIVAMRPADFRVTRTATISAPAAIVFAQVNDLHNGSMVTVGEA